MSCILFKEALLYGNLEVVNSLREIKKIKVEDFFETIKDFNLSHGGIYRFYINYKTYIAAKEFELIKENNPNSKILLDILLEIINKAEAIGVFENLNININTCDYNSIIKVFIYNLLHMLEYKIRTYILENSEVNQLHKLFCEYFKKYQPIFKTEYLIIDHITPLDNNSFWKPSWKINYKDEDYFLEGVDTYIDNIFIYPMINCHTEIMYLELRYINERINYLKQKTTEYYFNFIKDCVTVLSKNIFENFPLQIVYRDYYECMSNHSEFHKPELAKYIPLKDFNKDIYILSILPLYLTCYLLGFPILRSDVPSYKNIFERIKNFSEDYFENLAKDSNRKYIELISMGVNCGNSQNEDGDYLDLFYNRVIDFNIDDICHVFNNGVYHLFTSTEFYDISRKGTNFYNRSELKIIDPIIYNLRFKRKIKRFMNGRGLKIELNSTLKDNFKEIKEAIKNQEITREEIPTNNRANFIGDTLINFLMI